MRILPAALAVLAGAALGCAGLSPPRASPAPRLDFLGEATLPPGTSFGGAPVGGLSGLVWDPRTSLFLALSDDPGRLAPPRFYRLRVTLAGGRLADGDVTIVASTPLQAAGGSGYVATEIDPEGLAEAPDGTLYLSSEGRADRGVAPFVARLSADGRELDRFPLPARYLPDGRGTRGIRNNLAFESLAVTPSGKFLVAALENALVTDGPAADFGVASPCRILVWPLAGGGARELAYRVEPVSGAPVPPSAFRVNGLADLLALDDDRLLALERQFVAGGGVKLRIYLVSLAGATEVSARDGLGDPVPRFVSKRLLLDLSTLGVPLDNFEGMALGPAMPDGRRLMLVVSDDNFEPRLQRTRFLAFAVAFP